MAFKRYAALLAGSALIGSLTFVQPAMAEEATEPAQCVRIVDDVIQVAKAGTIDNPFLLGASSATVAGIPAAKMVNGNASSIKFTIPEDTTPGEYTVTLKSLFGTTATRTLTVTLEDKTVDKEEKFDCATITVGNVTVTTGKKTATVDAVVQDGASDLQVTAPEGLGVTVRDNGKTIAIDATDAEVKTYTVDFTYKAEGTDEEQKGSFQVNVVAQVVQTIADVTVTEGGKASQELTLAAGVSELKFTETHDLKIEHKEGKLIVTAGEVEVGTYTVNFTYKADGTDDVQKGSFEVKVVEKDEDEDEEKPKENASSKASSNFLSSFKGSSK